MSTVVLSIGVSSAGSSAQATASSLSSTSAGKVFVVEQASGGAFLIINETVGKKTVNMGGSGLGAAYDPKTKDFFFPNQESGTVTVVNNMNKFSAKITGFDTPVEALYVPENGMIYVFESSNGSLYEINPVTDSVSLAINLGSLGFYYETNPVYYVSPFMAYSSATREIYLVNTPGGSCGGSCPDQGSVFVVNPKTNDLVTTILLPVLQGCSPFGCVPQSIGYDAANTNIYVGDVGTSGYIYVIDSSNAYFTTITYFGGNEISGFAYNPTNQELYIADYGNSGGSFGGVYVMNSAGTISPVSSEYWDNPTQLAYNSNIQWVYVVNHGDDTVLPISGTTPQTLIGFHVGLSEIVAS